MSNHVTDRGRTYGLIAGMLSVCLSFLFFGRRQEVYLVMLTVGLFVAGICWIWILLASLPLKTKLIWTMVVIVSCVIQRFTEEPLIHLSYRIFISGHEKALSRMNR